MESKHELKWRGAVLLLGSYIFGINLHNIIHELGHAVTIWVQGGSIYGLVVHPFLACYAPSTYVPNHILLYAGGALIGGSATVGFAILAWRYRTPYMMPLVMACATGLLTTSCWMLIAPFSNVQTDYYFLISLGVPAVVIVLWGLLLLGIGLSVLALYLPLAGVSSETGFVSRLITLEIWILPYQIAGAIYQSILHGSKLTGALTSTLWMALIVFVIALISMLFQKRIRFFQRVERSEIRNTHVIVVWLAAAILIVAMLLFSMPREAVVQ
jgi:hypothetical protein